ncbi:MAG: flagellar biosynthesis protein FlhF [Hydrogenophilales bacterium]|nr:flagellar biosynthesis protein FlhF [Hydrogenophilales bacterium]
MIVKKFTAGTTRDALQQVRDALGPEALILSNRVQDGSVEIMAMAESDMASLTSGASPGAAAKPMRHDIPGIKILESTAPIKPPHAAETAPAEPSRTVSPESPAAVETLAHEVKNIRSLIERQLVNFAWHEMKSADPLKFDVLRTLLDVGFSPRLARQLSSALPDELDEEKALRWVRGAIAHNLHGIAPGSELIEQGGVFALVGPTGVGKTTTVAKLAARCVLKRGPASLALITTDTYRIGAHEQLKIYGKILNVPVYAVKDETELARTLDELRGKHLVLIDTAGMSQRDRRINAQIALLSSGKAAKVQRLLLLPATAQAGTLDDVIRAYLGAGLAGVVLTKIDEALSLAPVLDVVVRHKLALHYITNGQRVPEDLHRANPLYLVDRAFKCELAATHTPRDEEHPLKISAREDDAHAFLSEAQPFA